MRIRSFRMREGTGENTYYVHYQLKEPYETGGLGIEHLREMIQTARLVPLTSGAEWDGLVKDGPKPLYEMASP